MLTLNQPPLTQHISIPKDMSQLSVEAFTAGLVEGVMDGLDLVSQILTTHGMGLMVACESDCTYSRDGSVSTTYSHSHQAGSKGHGQRSSLGQVIRTR
jgi:hypothetical protein